MTTRSTRYRVASQQQLKLSRLTTARRTMAFAGIPSTLKECASNSLSTLIDSITRNWNRNSTTKGWLIQAWMEFQRGSAVIAWLRISAAIAASSSAGGTQGYHWNAGSMRAWTEGELVAVVIGTWSEWHDRVRLRRACCQRCRKKKCCYCCQSSRRSKTFP